MRRRRAASRHRLPTGCRTRRRAGRRRARTPRWCRRVIRPAATSIAPCQMTIVIALNIRKMTIDVMIARTRMRRLAVANTRSTGIGEARCLAALLVERLDDLHRAEDFAGDRADVRNAVLAALEIARTFRPSRTIGADDRRRRAASGRQLRRQREQDDHAGDADDRRCGARPRRSCRPPAR